MVKLSTRKVPVVCNEINIVPQYLRDNFSSSIQVLFRDQFLQRKNISQTVLVL